jgi:serine/threonine-protein kinase
MSGWLREHLRAAFEGQYTIERELGGGGMSRVFVAEETALGRRIAIKVLDVGLSGAVDVERFRREVAVAARLQHPHIVPVLTAGEAGGMLYYTMPYIQGESLRARLARGVPLPMFEIVCVIRDVARALACAHRQGIVHRDVKPENVLVHEGGDALVADFGIAKALSASTNMMCTAAGLVLGTPAYISPEQALCEPTTDHRADLYCLGLVAYELLAGVHPFAGRSPRALVAAHMVESPTPVGRHRPDAPRRLAALVMHLLEKHPAERPQTAEHVLGELNALADLPVVPMPAGSVEPSRRWHQLLVAAATQAAVTLTRGMSWGAVSIDPLDPCGPGHDHRTTRRWVPQLLAESFTAYLAGRSATAERHRRATES